MTQTLSMKYFFEKILQMPYYSNSQQNPQHENAVKDHLLQEGFQFVDKPAGLNKNNLNDLCLRKLKNNQFLYQPLGSQKSPDFIVRYNNKMVKIECKSSTNVFPVYNSGMPKQDIIYIFFISKIQ